MENAPAVFAGDGFCRMSGKKDDKKHVVQVVKMNCIEGNVKHGTKGIKRILKTIIWALNLKKL
ncbi:MAG: hypothetical protein KAH06_02970 [Desulfobacterales bacterium]|nr:hypothetical protein [Desulfobacterales bacterium]